MVDVNAVIRDKFFGVNYGLLVFVDEWRVPAPSVVPDFVEFLREDLNLVECGFEFFRLSTSFSSNHAESVTTGPTDRHRITGCSFPA